MKDNLIRIYLCCDLWWETLENIGYTVNREEDDIDSSVMRYSYFIPRIGERIDIEGYPFDDDFLIDLKADEKQIIENTFMGSYRIKDISYFIELLSQKECLNEFLNGRVNLILEKISDSIIHDTPPKI